MTIIEKLIEQDIISQKECDDLRLNIMQSKLKEYERTNPDETDMNNAAALNVGEQDALLFARIIESVSEKYRLSEVTDILKICEEMGEQYNNRTDNCVAALYPVCRYFQSGDENKRIIITFVFGKIAEKLPDPVLIAKSKMGQNLVYWFCEYIREFEEYYESVFKFPVLFGRKEEISSTEKEWAKTWKDAIFSVFDIYLKETEYIAYFRENYYSNNNMDILPSDTISNYRYRFTLSRMPIWLYHLEEEEKAVKLLTASFEDMDKIETSKETYQEEMIRIALDCTDFDSFQKLYEIITETNRITEIRMKKTEQLLNLYVSMKKSHFKHCSVVKNAMNEIEYAKYAKSLKKIRNIVAEDDFPICRVKDCLIPDSQNIKEYDTVRNDETEAEWLYKDDCQTIAELTKKLSRHEMNDHDIEDLSFWLSSMSSDEDVINNIFFDQQLQRLRDLSYLKQNGLVKKTKSMLELEKHRDQLYVEKKNDEIIKLKQKIEAKDEKEEEKVIKQTETLLEELQDYLMKRSTQSDKELSLDVQDRINKDMQTYCNKYLSDVNTHEVSYSLFDKIRDSDYRDEIYTQIFSGLLYYEKLKSFSARKIDYSGCVLQMVRVIEALLRYIYDNLGMPDSIKKTDSKYDSHYYDDEGNKKKEIEMGPLMYMFKCNSKNSSKVMHYGKNIVDLNNISVLKNPSLKKIDLNTIAYNSFPEEPTHKIQHIPENESSISRVLFEAINYIKNSYRNKSAHAGTVFKDLDAEQCRKILLNTECLLWILLTILK